MKTSLGAFGVFGHVRLYIREVLPNAADFVEVLWLKDFSGPIGEGCKLSLSFLYDPDHAGQSLLYWCEERFAAFRLDFNDGCPGGACSQRHFFAHIAPIKEDIVDGEIRTLVELAGISGLRRFPASRTAPEPDQRGEPVKLSPGSFDRMFRGGKAAEPAPERQDLAEAEAEALATNSSTPARGN